MRRRAGFSILELLIALAIVSAALAIAAHLMLEAQRRAAIEQRRAFDSAVAIALYQMRLDVTSATSGSGDAKLGEPLTLTLPSGDQIAYQLAVGGDLVRVLSNPAGQRVALRDVSVFQWTWLGGVDRPLVKVDVAYETTRSSGPRVAEGLRVDVPRGVEQRTLHLTLRGGGGVGW